MHRLLTTAALALLAATAAAEEGMWTFDNFPIAAANADARHATSTRPGSTGCG